MKANARSERRDAAYDRLVRQEELILDVTERLTEALRDTGMTRAELARRLGRTPGFVSQVFAGGKNLTLRTISDVAAALSLRPALELSPVRESAPQSVQRMAVLARARSGITGPHVAAGADGARIPIAGAGRREVSGK